jgi:predicted lipoprotein with Yx(FWY)xxD motif
MTRTRAALFGAATVLGLTLLSACGGAAQSGNTQAGSQDVAQQKAIVLAASSMGDLGNVLTDKDGMTLYRFDKDTAKPPVSNCTGECAGKWPPALATSDEWELQGVDKSMVGTIDRPDGGKQITVGGWALYRFSQDIAPGDTKGQGVGGTWYAATPEGKKAGEDAGPALASGVIAGVGTVLTDGKGMTLYRFDKDTSKPPVSNCEGDCIAKWPPAVAPAGDIQVNGVDKALVTTLDRKDGSKQILVNGWPMYHFAQDAVPGDAKGQGVGGTWFAAAPDGKKAAEANAAGAPLVLTTATVGNLGTVLTDKNGMTLYRFDKDTPKPPASNCNGDCSVKWPPLLVDSDNFQVTGVDKALVGTVVRADGKKQVTVAGWPLYTYSLDINCGDANGQGVGGTWFVSTPEGKKAGV